jgi:predicted nucleic acid-binding protein
MILADTSVWIDHLNKGPDERLVVFLNGASIVMHDFVLGEIAMGSLRSRRRELAMLRDLPRLPAASNAEAFLLIESADLHGTGLSFIDVHLLAAARASSYLEPVRIWTGDKRLHAYAEKLDVAYLA